MRICDLREKEIVNMSDCKRLGNPMDVSFDIHDGCILELIIPGPTRLYGLFGCDSEYIIPFECIRKIGPDIILVDICEEECLRKCK